ncbi:response regulator [Haloprofundus salinisoli]|uniref:response regulator n=1 Tax=Haloprofundus salinisoli TaxID=2876193 RepID=UPI001CCE7B92|nr:response regulator [Haloprofundus salinisoli]
MSEQDCTKEPADILLVEDNPGDVRLTEEAFNECRITNTLHVVGDGIEALDFLYQRGDHADAPRPDLILLDLNLPRKNGDEVLEEIAENRELSRIPVLVLTSSKSEADIVRSYDLHANAYLTKPVNPEVFVEMVRTFEQFWFSIVQLPPKERG